jgi:hypothetical protein
LGDIHQSLGDNNQSLADIRQSLGDIPQSLGDIPQPLVGYDASHSLTTTKGKFMNKIDDSIPRLTQQRAGGVNCPRQRGLAGATSTQLN